MPTRRWWSSARADPDHSPTGHTRVAGVIGHAVNSNAPIRAYRVIFGVLPRVDRDEHVIVPRVSCNRVGAGLCRDRPNEFIRLRVDDAQHRAALLGRIVASGNVVIAVAWIEPHLVRAADLRDPGDLLLLVGVNNDRDGLVAAYHQPGA